MRIQVFNVGQGDAILLSPGDGCVFSGADIYVDVGPGQRDIFVDHQPGREMIILLSHAHRDHIGGLMRLAKYQQDVRQWWLPCYYDEVLTITEFLLHLRGIERVALDHGPRAVVQQVLSTAEVLQHLAECLGVPVVGCYAGMPLDCAVGQCGHAHAYNPPLQAHALFQCTADAVQQYQRELVTSQFADLQKWVTPDYFPMFRARLMPEMSERERGGRPFHLVPDDEVYRESRRQFLVAFLLALHRDLDAFVQAPSGRAFARLFKRVRATSNDTSIVLRFAEESWQNAASPSILLTGDVGLGVFRRLQRAGHLPHANILKIPHHGSRYAMDATTLQAIRPDVAIVSHDNRRFGQQHDPHPHQAVVSLLQDTPNLITLYTNDVRKGGDTVAQQSVRLPAPQYPFLSFSPE